MKTLKNVSEIHWYTYANDNQNRKYVVVYYRKDEFAALFAENPQEVARAILQVITQHGIVIFVGPETEYRHINDL